MEISNDIKNNSSVKHLIRIIRVLWDTRQDGILATNWLNDLDNHSHESKVFGMLFGSLAKGEETPKLFAKRLANIK